MVVNVFHRVPTEHTREEFDSMGPIASRGVSVPEFLRKHIAICDFPEG